MSHRLPGLPRPALIGVLSCLVCVTGCGQQNTTNINNQDGDDDATVDATSVPLCTDQDQDGSCLEDGDCNDVDATIHPGATEVCGDGVDSDCDTLEGCEVDNDHDGYNENQGDCNDADSTIRPGGTDLCDNGIDEDCDGEVDNNCPNRDDDGDGYCDSDSSCNDGAIPGDCDDLDAQNFPGNVESFDGRDNNCDDLAENRVSVLKPGQTRSFDGDVAGQLVGWSVAGLNTRGSTMSYNGDAFADIVIGMPGYGLQERGGVAVVLGGGDWSSVPDILTPSSTGPLIYSENLQTSRAGWSVSQGFDLNYDLVMDMVTGAPFYSTEKAAAAGISYLNYGTSAGQISRTLEESDLYVTGYFPDVHIGYSNAGGDVTGDGIDDFIMGCPSDPSWIFVLPGGPTLSGKIEGNLLWKLELNGDYFLGESLAFAGHTDDDAYGDFVVGGYYDANKQGVVALIPGNVEMDIAKTVYSLEDAGASVLQGTKAQENAGWALSGDGDVNGDGYSDFISGDELTVDRDDPVAFLFLGGPYFLNNAAPANGVYVMSSAANMVIKAGSEDACPCSVSLNGDMDQDGYSDILVGTSGSDNGAGAAGRVYLIKGRANLPSSLILDQDADYILEGTIADEQVGFSVSWAGDINGDGLDDFVVGAPGADLDASNLDSGRAYILFGIDPD